jgi:acetyl-CoA carboxylase carboxyltransferase component
MRAVLREVLDEGESLEIQPLFGRSIITALGRLGGESIAIVANQPTVLAGAIDRDAADKAARFLQVADAFHVPVLFLADNPGVLSGSKAERAGTLRAAARLYMAQSRLRVPKLHVTLRKAYGFGSSVMGMNPFDGQTLSLAFPGISLGGLPAAGAAVAGFDEAGRQNMAERQSEGAWTAGDTLAYDEIIDPRELRNALLAGLALGIGRRAGASPGHAHNAAIWP